MSISTEQDFWSKLGEPCPVEAGTRIRLLAMPDDPDPVPSGTMGTVLGGNGAQITVAWDNGRLLRLLVDVDRFEII